MVTHARNDMFGWAVAISDSTAVVGAPGAHNGNGRAYIFIRSGKIWRYRATVADPKQGSITDSAGLWPFRKPAYIDTCYFLEYAVR